MTLSSTTKKHDWPRRSLPAGGVPTIFELESASVTVGAAGRVPVILITGFLGSGKTTLLRRLLAADGMTDTALIINEFGAIGLDQMLVQSAIENVLLMEDGCLCCSIRGDLIDTIGDLFSKVASGELPQFSRVIIETTGLADPRPIVQDLVNARGLSRRVELAKVIVTIDGVLGASQLEEVDEVVAQVVQADLCIVTKCDVVDLETKTELVRRLRDVNPTADIILGDSPEASVSQIMTRKASMHRHTLSARAFACGGGETCTHPAGSPCPGHAGLGLATGPGGLHRDVQSWSIHHEDALSWERVCRWLDVLYSSRPANMLRMKGILYLEGHANPVVVHGVGAMVDEPTLLAQWPWPRPASEIVVIAKGLAGVDLGRLFHAIVIDASGARSS